MLELKKIDKTNWEKTLDLKLHEEQKKSIAPNVYSLAQLQFLDDFEAKGIYLDDIMIGFAMYGIDEEDEQYWIYRFMIDKNHQGKGYGQKAMQLIIEDIQNKKASHHHSIMISYKPTNSGAKRTYEKAGFKEIDLIISGEQVAQYSFM